MKAALTKQELLEPIRATCGKCGGEAWIIPIPQSTGSCLCSKCTFGQEGLSLSDMLIKVFIDKQQ